MKLDVFSDSSGTWCCYKYILMGYITVHCCIMWLKCSLNYQEQMTREEEIITV